jgi:hypothetical protein
MPQLTECDACGALATVERRTPIFNDKQITDLFCLAGLVDDIDCPHCGQRTQRVGDEQPDLR